MHNNEQSSDFVLRRAASRSLRRGRRNSLTAITGLTTGFCYIGYSNVSQRESPITLRGARDEHRRWNGICGFGSRILFLFVAREIWQASAINPYERTEMSETIEMIEWNGGECPVPLDTVVRVTFRSRLARRDRPAHRYFWSHHNNGGDIVAYQIVATAPTEKDEG